MEPIYLATLLVALISSIFSGIAGGGGGFIMSPYWLLAGLSPAQGANVGSFTAIGMGVSSLAAFRKSEHLPKDTKLIVFLSIVAILASLIGAIVLPKIDVSLFTNTLAWITIAALPLLFIRRGNSHRFMKHRNIGIILLALLLVVGSIVMSSAFSILIALVMMSFLDLSVLKMTALRRLVTLSQSITLFIFLTLQGFFIWQHALAGLIGGSIGSYIGTKFAISRGEEFAKWTLAVGALLGAVALLLR